MQSGFARRWPQCGVESYMWSASQERGTSGSGSSLLSCTSRGLVATQKEPEANHVWRIVARSDLDALGLTEASVVCQHSDWAALPPEPEDAILLLKRRMHSTKLSQDPLLLLPKAVAAKLNPADLKPAETNELGEATCKEFRKTAQAMGKQPWNLLKAEEYLQKLCTRNEARMLPEMPEPPHVIFNYTMAKIGGGAQLPGIFADGVQEVLPREVAAQKPTGAELTNRAKQILGQKRPAAAAATPGAVRRPAGAMGPGVMRRPAGAMGPGVMRRPAAAAGGGEPAVAAGGEPAARECFEPAVAAGGEPAVAAGGELEDEKECLEPAVAEGAGGESEAEEDCDIAEPAPKKAARDKEKGCAKCKWIRKGCGRCRRWAEEGLHGYYFQDDEVIAGG